MKGWKRIVNTINKVQFKKNLYTLILFSPRHVLILVLGHPSNQPKGEVTVIKTTPCGFELGDLRARGTAPSVPQRRGEPSSSSKVPSPDSTIRIDLKSTPGCSSVSPPLVGHRKPKNSKLLSFNANGLQKNIPELTNCMSENGINIALIQETYLKPNRPRACAIAGYVQLRTDRTYARREGTTLYYSRSLHCCTLTIPPLTDMEATGCRLAMTGHRTIVVVSVYLPYPKPLLRSDLRVLLALGDAVILFGDFNCKNPRWGCAIMDQNGEKLDRLQDRLEFEIIAPSTATYFPYNDSNRLSTLDIALTKGVALNLNSIETLHSLLSDHRPVLLKMGPPDGGRPISTIEITDWKRVSTAFEKIDTPPLNSIPDDIRMTEEIDHAIGALTSHVRTVIKKCERKVPAFSDRWKFPPDILELIRAKNAALRRASAYPTPEYRSRARALQREVKGRVQEFRNESWSDLMEEIRPSHQAFWKTTKALQTEGYTPIPPPEWFNCL
ncbi:RNA-directed DNA polymerase from mobile element jockey [Eumeta japonica]|uniref:RNA-directed DNA polymerase from mobile element jockey n=1 Tax=Eumeta variegata TaxID=151549 RepID=A0A4C1XP89_EUMVA|nr:RNA-directed DNA polymerase from mobile element jockey [Eumeta japonica]